eukprot:2716648-Prymnesium_polylepis.1
MLAPGLQPRPAQAPPTSTATSRNHRRAFVAAPDDRCTLIASSPSAASTWGFVNRNDERYLAGAATGVADHELWGESRGESRANRRLTLRSAGHICCSADPSEQKFARPDQITQRSM